MTSELPVENLIIREDGFRKLLNAFDTRCMNPSVSLGSLKAPSKKLVRYSRDREAFGCPIGTMQGMLLEISRDVSDIEVGRSILWAAASANPFPDPYLAGIAKMYCNEMAIRVTSEALQVHDSYTCSMSAYFAGHATAAAAARPRR